MAFLGALVAVGCGDDSEPAGDSGQALRGEQFISRAMSEGGERREFVMKTELRLSFGQRKGGTNISWRAGCNTLGADVEITEDQLIIGDAIGTQIGCPLPLAQQDRRLTDFFESDPSWSLEGDRLRLVAGDQRIDLNRRTGGISPPP